ncbi:MAG: S1/P1 nuclease [Xanthobacteraceae bacterium]
MRRLSACVALLLLAFLVPARGWDHEGHQLVGSIADQLLAGHPAEKQIESILGFKLRIAATWPDCARSIKPQKDGSFSFVYDPEHPEYTAPCPPFLLGAERPRLEDYVARNWNNCAYSEGELNEKKGCHETYHFADVPIHRNRYYLGYAGTNEHDIVQAINAAIAVLKGELPRPPFSIKDKKEALFLLAHFVGDLHQPLHVGGVYLDSKGKPVEPDTPADVKKDQETFGGNALYDGRVPLHVIWDDTPKELGTRANAALVSDARAVPPTSGDIGGWAAAWASESLIASQGAFADLTFDEKGQRGWDIKFKDRTTYLAMVPKVQRERIILAGARLAALLKAVWPQ